MLTITRIAVEKFRETIEDNTKGKKVAIRIIRSTTKPNRFSLTFGQKRHKDLVMKTEDGIDLLLIDPDLAPELEGVVIDYQTTSQSSGFILSKPVPGT